MNQAELLEQEQVISRLLQLLMPHSHNYASHYLDIDFIKEHNEAELYGKSKLIHRICDISLLDYVLIHICREYGYENRFITSDNTICNTATTNIINSIYRVVRTLDGRKFVFAYAKNIDDIPALIRKSRLTEIINAL